MALRPRRALALACIGIALVASIGPSAAFDWADVFPRDVGANLASASNAYAALTIVSCPGNLLTGIRDCDGNIITNKASTGMTYRILKESDSGNKIQDYGIDGGSVVTSGYTGWTSEKAVSTGTAAMNLDINTCLCSGQSFQTYWTVEGQKTGTLDFTLTKIQITVTYT